MSATTIGPGTGISAARTAISNAIVLGVSNARQVKAYTSQKVDFIPDITGYVS